MNDRLILVVGKGVFSYKPTKTLLPKASFQWFKTVGLTTPFIIAIMIHPSMKLLILLIVS